MNLTEIRFESASEHLQLVRGQVRNAIQNLGFTNDELNCIILAVGEACMNVIQHAYGPQSKGEIILDVIDNGDSITFKLTDFAPAVDKSKIKSRNLDDIRPGGLGVHLINEVMDHVELRNDPEGIGNVLTMIKNRPKR